MPGLNGGGAAAAVPPTQDVTNRKCLLTLAKQVTHPVLWLSVLLEVCYFGPEDLYVTFYTTTHLPLIHLHTSFIISLLSFALELILMIFAYAAVQTVTELYFIL